MAQKMKMKFITAIDKRERRGKDTKELKMHLREQVISRLERTHSPEREDTQVS